MAKCSGVSTGGFLQPQPHSSQGVPPLPSVALTYHIKASAVSQHMSSLCVWAFNVIRLSFTCSKVSTDAQWNRGQPAASECSGEGISCRFSCSFSLPLCLSVSVSRPPSVSLRGEMVQQGSDQTTVSEVFCCHNCFVKGLLVRSYLL